MKKTKFPLCLRILLIAFAGLLIFLFFTGERSPEYLFRSIVYNQSGISDYQLFPERVIQNAGPVFKFKSAPEPDLFQEVTYKSGGQQKTESFDDFLRNHDTTAFLVIQNDEIIYEGYFNGYQRNSIETSFSTAKSFNSALIGIAIDEGYIHSVDDPVIHYLPELKGRGLDEMTLRQLLNMSSGIGYKEQNKFFPLLAYESDDPKSYYFPDLRRIALKNFQPGDEPLGQYFHYNNYHPLLEGMIIERATGRHVAEYLQEKIWKPLGMEFPASWSLDSTASGFEKMESGINARAIDFAKFGRLFLNKGNWNGKQLISEKWVLESTSPDPQDQRPWTVMNVVKDHGGYYKYHWWGLLPVSGHYDYYAAGHLGQFIYICQEKNLIIARYGRSEGKVDSWPAVFKQIEDGLQ